MANWRNMHFEGLAVEHKVVSVFRVYDSRGRLPFAHFKFEVVERNNGALIAIPDVAVREVDGNANWTCGFGDSVDAALEDGLRNFYASMAGRGNLSEAEIIRRDDRSC